MEGLLPTSVKVAFTPSKPGPAALARGLRIFATTRNPNRRRIGHWSEYQGMALRLVQFLAVMRTALAHLAALPKKMAMAQAAYFCLPADLC